METFANVPRIIARGAAWFRTEGTERSPGTVVCTITGATELAGVGEVMLGTPLAAAIEEIGGGMRLGRQLKAVLSGVSNGVLGLADVNTPLTYEDLAGAGGGLGSAGFVVFDDTADMTAVAAGVARFLAVESCGQCTACKQDGLGLATSLARLCRNEGRPGRPRRRAQAPPLGHRRRPLQPGHPAAGGRREHPRAIRGPRSRPTPTAAPRPPSRCWSPSCSASKEGRPCSTSGMRPSSRTGPTARSTPGKRPPIASASTVSPSGWPSRIMFGRHAVRTMRPPVFLDMSSRRGLLHGLRIQRAVKAGAKTEFLFGRNEGGGQAFHGWVDRARLDDAKLYSAFRSAVG